MRRRDLWRCTRERGLLWMISGAILIIAGCAAQQKTTRPPSSVPAPLLSATKQQLITSYNDQAASIHSVNASVLMKLTAGTAYSGVIKQYHEISGFILAQKPADIRVIGQAPLVGTTIFDMASDGTSFHMYIPSKGAFLEGPASLQRPSAKPIENLRPEHLIQAIFWNPIAPDEPVLFSAGDEAAGRYYVLTVVENAANATSGTATNWSIERKVWFDRTHLSMARVQIYNAAGDVTSDIQYTDWHSFGNARFPENVVITRPAEGYELHIQVKKLTANEAITPDRFELKQPAATKLVQVGEETKEPKL